MPRNRGVSARVCHEGIPEVERAGNDGFAGIDQVVEPLSNDISKGFINIAIGYLARG